MKKEDDFKKIERFALITSDVDVNKVTKELN